MIKSLPILLVLLWVSVLTGQAAEPVLTVSISGCATNTSGKPPPIQSRLAPVEPRLDSGPGWVRFVATERHNCCLQVEVHQHVEGHTLTLTEFWSGNSCRCICISLIEATVSNLPPAEYTVKVVRLNQLGTNEPTAPVLRYQDTVQIP